MSRAAMRDMRLGLPEEAKPIDRDEDDVLDEIELTLLAWMAEHPELENPDVAHARQIRRERP